MAGGPHFPPILGCVGLAIPPNVSAYDAFYVTVAREHGIPLMTADGRLPRAPGLGVAVQHVRIG